MYFGFENINIAFGDKKVLTDLSVEFNKGSISTIIGQNGCGKSSLLKIISKAVKPESGKIWLEGREYKSYKNLEVAKKVAMLPQVHSSPADIDVRTLVSYGRYPYMKFGRGLTMEDAKIIDEAINLTGLSHLKHQPVKTLSGGERQRAWIAMTICQQPEILILDEPTTYLDISYQIEVLELVKELNEKLGLTIIMVLHDLNLAARYSHYLYAIKDGNIYAKGTPREVMTKAVLRDIFRINVSIEEDAKNQCPYFIVENTVIAS